MGYLSGSVGELFSVKLRGGAKQHVKHGKLFRSADVFDPDHIPEELLTDAQLKKLAMNLMPALEGARPVNCLCLGPPATGKTTVRMILKQLEGFNGDVPIVLPVYINCQLISSRQQVLAKIYEKVFNHPLPFRSAPFSKLYDTILNRIKDCVLVVALDDLNALLSDSVNDILYTLLKAHEEVDGAKIGVIGIATDVRLAARLDPRAGSIFRPDEIYFPLYDAEEIAGILKSRARAGLSGIADEAFEMIVDLAFEAKDVRFGIYLLKLAGISAEARGSRKVEVCDVEAVSGRGKVAFVKNLKALSEAEKALLQMIYSDRTDSDSYVATADDLYEEFKEIIHLGYTKFNQLLYRLDDLRFIDVVRERSRKRTVYRRFDSRAVLEALKSVSP